MILRRVGRSHRKGLHSGRKAARLSCFARGSYFNDQGRLCTNYPTLPINPKEFCEYIVPLSDGRHELTDGGVYERILDGEQLGELK